MPAMAYIQDAQSRLTLHTAQALGVSSLSSGETGVCALGRLPSAEGAPILLSEGLSATPVPCTVAEGSAKARDPSLQASWR